MFKKSLRPQIHKFFKCLSEFRVKNGINYGIHETIHVAQPRGQQKGRYAGIARKVELAAHGVEDVAREEWNPANQKHSCKKEIYFRTVFIAYN